MGQIFALRIVIAAALLSACTPHPNGRGCPAGAYLETRTEESYDPVRCVRPNGVPDGPFLFHDFDEVRRTWSTRTGNYSEGEMVPPVRAAGDPRGESYGSSSMWVSTEATTASSDTSPRRGQ